MAENNYNEVSSALTPHQRSCTDSLLLRLSNLHTGCYHFMEDLLNLEQAKTSAMTVRQKRDLLLLIGLLNHAATVVRPGWSFLCSLIDASATTAHLDHWVHLNALARADISWWHTFIEHWNGISLVLPATPAHFITSDASGTWASMALRGVELPIAPKELVPIVLVLALWGPQRAGTKVCCWCDNSAVVWAINKGSARDPKLMRLLRCLCFTFFGGQWMQTFVQSKPCYSFWHCAIHHQVLCLYSNQNPL